GQADLVAGTGEPVGELPDRGGLPRPVHAHHHHHGEAARLDVELMVARQDLGDLVGEKLRGVLVLAVSLPDSFDDRLRRVRADVCPEEDLLEAAPFVLGRGLPRDQLSYASAEYIPAGDSNSRRFR